MSLTLAIDNVDPQKTTKNLFTFFKMVVRKANAHAQETAWSSGHQSSRAIYQLIFFGQAGGPGPNTARARKRSEKLSIYLLIFLACILKYSYVKNR